MYLKTLTLRGFKSFASATTLRFEPGITCVVGPNGSGKSNVVDALVVGDGRAGRQDPARRQDGGRHLRRHVRASAAGPRRGACSPSTTPTAPCPIEYTEVTISRTMFRNGGSEYAINGEACRLLDVQELLSDSGIGREMHVIVGQGQLDSVLSATPEDRRGFIEEAAGVLKHRQAQGEGPSQARRDGGQPRPAHRPHRGAATSAEAARPAGRGGAPGQRHPGRGARRAAAPARRRPARPSASPSSRRSPTRTRC